MFRVLIIEDSNIFRQMLGEALHNQFPKMDILETANGEEAFKKIAAFPPDLIFMDIKLPGESGLELTKKIKTRYPNITIVILTAYDIPEYREAAVQAKANFFLSKGSASKENILTLVESILSEQRNDSGDPKSKNP